METIPDLSGVEVAIGGGPVLIKDSKIMSWKGWLNTNIQHPRTAVGWNKTHIFLVEVDGRQIDLSLGMTFQELAEYMLKLGCQQAMNLDGGGSATLWALGMVRSSPSEGQERPSPNALVVVRKNSRPVAK
jgi:exopolysaccharide biosynthesis protein